MPRAVDTSKLPEVALIIRNLREQTKMSQKAFGEFIGGAAIRTIQDWERGLREPPEYVLSLIKFKIDTEIKNSGE